MLDVDRALEEIGRFGDRPPLPPRGLGEIEQQAAGRRRRKRLAGAGLAAACVLAVALVAGSLVGGDEGQHVQVVDEPTTTLSTEPAPAPIRNPTVTPSTGLVDGQVVIVSGIGDRESAGVAQCASEAISSSDPAAWCDDTQPRTWGVGSVELTVAQIIDTANGPIDCAENTRRCIVGIRTSIGDTVVRISFDGAPDPPDEEPVELLGDPVIEISAPTVTDGGRIEVRGSGFAPDHMLVLSQCQGTVAEDWDDWRLPHSRCDNARSAALTADPDGAWTAPYLGYAEIQTYDGWAPCDPCVLVVTGYRHVSAVTTLTVTTDGAPIRPEVRIVPEGPYESGQRVRLEGSGFQTGASGSSLRTGWCAFRTDSPETEIQGDHNYGYTTCAYPSETAFGVPTDELGRFVVDNFPLPSGAFGHGLSGDCADPELRCGLAWHPGEGTLPVFVTLFELR